MPVEIKELVIRAVAEDFRTPSESEPGSRMSADEKEAIIEAAVKQVLKILKRSKER
jgi:hypothetical protein